MNNLRLSENAKKFVRDTTSTYQDEIRFYANRMTYEVLFGYDEKERIELLKEINDSIKNNETWLSIKFLGHSYGSDMKDIDKELVELFVKHVNAYFTNESQLTLKNIGIEI